jgi:GTP-binding protein Era
MVNAAWHACEDADAIVLLADASARQPDALTEAIIQKLKERRGGSVPRPLRAGTGVGLVPQEPHSDLGEPTPHQQKLRLAKKDKPKFLQPPPQGGRNANVILVLNKIDAIEVGKLLPLAARLNENGIATDIFMISALTGDGINDLKKHLIEKMPKSPWFFEPDQMSDLPSSLLAAEATREQLYKQLQQELPYGATVAPESWETKKDGSAVIRQSIVVARANHKPIILGKGGARIKAIGQAARKEIENMLGIKAHLFLEVKVDEKWQDRPDFYKICGLEFSS